LSFKNSEKSFIDTNLLYLHLIERAEVKMNTINHGKVQVSYGPCPPEEFAGRFTERKQLTEIFILRKQ
jgi:hypothetical protein